nr:MAG: hypothetical protein [Bacteriophage sp.]
MDEVVDADLLGFRLYFFDFGLCGEVEGKGDAVAEAAGDAVEFELPFVPDRHAEGFEGVFDERAFGHFGVGVGLAVVDAADDVGDCERVGETVVNDVVDCL